MVWVGAWTGPRISPRTVSALQHTAGSGVIFLIEKKSHERDEAFNRLRVLWAKGQNHPHQRHDTILLCRLSGGAAGCAAGCAGEIHGREIAGWEEADLTSDLKHREVLLAGI
jgi:hypothetical protein